VRSGNNNQGGGSRPPNSQHNNNKGKNSGDRCHWNNKGGGHNNKGGNKNNSTTFRQNDSSPRSMPNGIVYGGTDVSSSSTFCSPVLDTHYFSAGTNQSEGILGSHPNVISQICLAPGHSADTCPNRYHPRQQPVLPAYATFNSVDAGEQIWYPDSAAASHMTPNDGKLLTKSVFSGSSLVKVGNGTLLPIKHVGHSVLTTPIKPLRLSRFLHVPQLRHNLLSVRKLCRDNNCCVVFDSDSVLFKDKTTGEVLLQAS